MNTYRTADDRFISLVLLQPDKFWDDLAARLERPELVTDERFSTSAARAQNTEACVEVLDEAFGSKPSGTGSRCWPTSPACGRPTRPSTSSTATPRSSPTATSRHGGAQWAAGPARGQPGAVRRTPTGGEPGAEHGEHTEQVLLDAGFDWGAISAMKDAAIL